MAREASRLLPVLAALALLVADADAQQRGRGRGRGNAGRGQLAPAAPSKPEAEPQLPPI
jgi:hypothetical protein